ncbi:uncharacterized protein LOC129598745 [Paramacrobiotus metropolitanus]|uniref:uncharacterized protein LOC129598745 n=1 Tax=Paramacrobiotus metropolitanus TaxID=2943436 RepID=UPI002445EBBB|nr:uncharacterized protein LOC129598745 [Paramacrobiotus metropolitanus]
MMHATVRRLASWCVFWDERYFCRTLSLDIERCTFSTRSFGASGTREDGTPVPADAKKPDAAASIDEYLKSVHLKHKIRNDFAMKHEYNRLRRMSRSLTPVQPIAEPSFLSSRIQGKAESRHSPQNYLDPDAMLSKLETADREGKALPIMDLVKYASTCAQHGRVEGVELCQKIMAEHNEEEFERQMKLQHYLGNALWMAGRFRDSVDVFKTAFRDYPLGRRKIINLFRFSIYRAVNTYPCPEQFDSLNEFVDYAAEFKELQVGVFLWRALFQHPSPAALTDADKLLSRHPGVQRLIPGQCTTLLEQARRERDAGLLYRLLTLLKDIPTQFKDFKHLSGCAFDALMEMYCRNEDVEGGKGLLQLGNEYALEYGPIMWPETVQRLDRINPAQKPVELPAIKPIAKPKGFKLQF